MGLTTMTMTIGIIGCAKGKRAGPAMALDLYDPSVFFREKLDYLHALGVDEVAVLSAAHGVVPMGIDESWPTLDPYDTTLATMSPEERAAWCAAVRWQLAQEYGHTDVRFVVVAGAMYRAAFDGLDHDAPLAGLGIGQQRAHMAAAVRAAKERTAA